MTDQPLTLSELADRSGVEIRTLRSWMQQGVIPGPESVGRNARYAASTLTRVLAVKAMRDVYGLSLAEIRRDLLSADEGRIDGYAALASGGGESAASPAGTGHGRSGSPSVPDAAPPPAASSAAEYLRSLRSAGVFGKASPGGDPLPKARSPAASPSVLRAPPRIRPAFALPVDPSPAAVPSPGPPPASDRPEGISGAPGGGSRLARLAEALEHIAGSRPARRKARGEVRLHIPITPDLELTVRGDHSPQEIARFEQVADLLRTILTGGSDHD